MNLSACSERASLNSPLKLAASSFALLAWVTIPKNWPQFTFLVSQYLFSYLLSLPLLLFCLSVSFLFFLFFRISFSSLFSHALSSSFLQSAHFILETISTRCSPPPRQRWRGPWRRASWAARRTSWPTPGLAGQCPHPLSLAYPPFPNKLTSIWNTTGTCH